MTYHRLSLVPVRQLGEADGIWYFFKESASDDLADQVIFNLCYPGLGLNAETDYLPGTVSA